MPGSFLNGHNPLTDEISLFLLQVFIIVATSRLLAIPLKLLRQPVVISEVIGGILLGPSAIGKIPGFSDTIFPKSSLPSLKLISQFGLIFYLYLVGMELDASKMKSQFKLAAAISLAGIALPFLSGIGIAKILYDTLADQTKVSFSTFLIFCGVAMSITAFPVLARILSERQLMPTDVGQATLTAAAVDDAIAWVLLGLVVALIKNPDSAITALYVFLATLAYAIFLWVLIRPLFVRMVKWGHEEEYYENTTVVITLLMVIVSGFFTEAVGIDAIFGGFLIGVITPHEHGFSIKMTEKIEDLVTSLFLPLYFAYSGLNTRVDEINSFYLWGMVLLVTSAAIMGKVLGCSFASKAVGYTWRESFAIGFLMSTKGLVELIVLNLGLQSGVITQDIFTIFVLMALITTFMTVPVISSLYPYSMYLGKRTDDVQSILDSEYGDQTAQKMHVVVVVPSLHTVRAVMIMTRFLTAKSLVHITALRLIELSDRMSRVIMDNDPKHTLKSDPALNMFRSFGENDDKVKISSLVTVSTLDNYADLVNTATIDLKSELVIFPVEGSRLLGVAERIFSLVQCPVAVLVDHGFADNIQSFMKGESLDDIYEDPKMKEVEPLKELKETTIVFLYNGSADDKEAAFYVSRMIEHENVSVTLIHIVDNPLDSADTDPTLDKLKTMAFKVIDVPRVMSIESSKLLSNSHNHLIVVGKSTLNDQRIRVNGTGTNLKTLNDFLAVKAETSYLIVRAKYTGPPKVARVESQLRI